MLASVPCKVFAQSSDNGDGTFTNPVMWADFPDPDVIRVGDKYYMVSTSMHYFPGVTLLESTDLVNWQIAANTVGEFNYPRYDLNGGNQYSKGQWATSIRYFNNQFHLLFTALNQGSFMCVANDPHGPWTLHKIPNSFLYDPGLFVDTDGRVYVIHGNTEIAITELTADGLKEKTPSKVIYKAHRPGLEGNHCYKIGDYYYIYCTYGGPQGSQICLRSKSLYGPFEEREVMNDEANYADMVIHQGCLINLPDGSYWSMIFQDHGGLGRIPFLVPVNWIDKWPVLGNPMDGNLTLNKPIAGSKITPFPTSDEFNSSALEPQWQFNHNPTRDKYSLTERKGWLRLHTVTLTDSIMKAQNTVCQRIFGPHSEGTAKIDLSHMQVGDKAGLMLLQEPNASLTVYRSAKGYQLQMTVNDKVESSQAIKSNIIYLRANVNGVSDKVNFSYSLDNKSFKPFGKEFKMEFRLSIFCGNRYGLFNYATQKKGGWVDVDWFRVTHEPLLSRDDLMNKDIEAEYFDYQHKSKVRRSRNDADNRNQDVTFEDGGMIAFKNINPKEAKINKMDLSLECTSPNARLEIRSHDTGKILGMFSLATTEGKYQTLSFDLNEDLVSTKRLELIEWKPNKEGVIALDKFKFSTK
jgi:Beta-xylosidase